MRKEITNAAIFAALTLMAHAEDEFYKEEIRVTPLNPSHYVLNGAGTNMVASIGSDGTLLVDDDYFEMADKLIEKLKELKGDRPRFIINTHFHYDHTGGNKVFGSSATIIAATPIRDRLMTEQVLWKHKHPAFPTYALPSITFDDKITLHVNNENIQLLHLPHGHTDGDTVVFFDKSKIVAMGDIYFAGMFPIFHPEHGGHIKDFAKNVGIVLKQCPEDAQIVPGHGPLSNKRELEAFHMMLLSSIDKVEKEIKNGFSLEQILKAGLPEWEKFSHGYANTDRWLTLLYNDLLQNNSK